MRQSHGHGSRCCTASVPRSEMMQSIGNSIFSLGFLLTANPLTAVLAHIAMHIASVFHGIDTTVTLPPHY